ncbi:S1 family peptidase [Methyloprofundus sp.]|uniref:S1 family peptidase n=1 Tax=Methyloprofundus sp. TaxID=2020875 RepID=UPI003D13E666
MPNKIIISILTLLLLSTNSSFATERLARIIGGKPVNSEAWPWMAGLVYKNTEITNEVFCGATLIAPDWVLTAAHCVIGVGISDFEIIINQAQLDSDSGERLSASAILFHPLYNDFLLENDLALIKLATPSNIKPINVLAPFSTQDSAGKPAFALGWGSISSSSLQYPSTLQQVELPIIDNPRCDIAMGDITEDMLCAGDGLGERDTCFGDSGGPLVVFDTESGTWRQAGITSWGFDCAATGFYGVYTRLKNYAQFISEHICSTQEMPPATSLNLDIDGNIVSASWNAINDISGYRLNFTPYPEAQTIYSLDLNQTTDLSVELNTGSAFYVAITGYNGNCLSQYSNIEHFILN